MENWFILFDEYYLFKFKKNYISLIILLLFLTQRNN
jgi:hypothetical protein